MKIAIAYPQHALLTTVVNVLEMLTEANSFNRMLGDQGAPPFEISVMGARTTMDHAYGISSFHCIPFDDQSKDLVIVPAIKGFDASLFDDNRELVSYLQDQYSQGSKVMSICSGALLLAEAGILDGKRAATHWAYGEFAQAKYPTVQFEFVHPFIDLGDVMTSTGAFSSNASIIYLIEKYASKELSLFTARMYLTDYHVPNANYFIPLDLKMNHHDERILKIQTFIHTGYESSLSVEEIAQEFNMSKRNLTKSFKEATGINPSEFIQLVRVKKATELLEATEQSISEVMYKVGYGDPSAFRKVFKKLIGLVPSDYRMKFNRIRETIMV